MSWQDREYARRPVRSGYGWGGGGYGGGFGAWWRGGGVVRKLIVINVAVFVACLLTGGDGSVLYRYGWLRGADVIQHGQVWRLITCTFLHADFMHILFNMIGLYFFGTSVERHWGPKMFLGVYLGCGVLANIVYVVATQVRYLDDLPAIGASGCVLAILGAAAVLFPGMLVYMLFLPFPIKIRTIALVYGGMYFFNVYQRGANAGGDLCHLAGMLAGAWWAWRGHRWWVYRGSARAARFSETVRQRRPKPSGQRPRAAARSVFKPSAFQEDQQILDRLLQKVHDGGIHSLTDQEKAQLKEISERMRTDFTA